MVILRNDTFVYILEYKSNFLVLHFTQGFSDIRVKKLICGKLSKIFLKFWRYQIIWYLSAGLKIIKTCFVNSIQCVNVFSVKIWFMKTSTRIVKYKWVVKPMELLVSWRKGALFLRLCLLGIKRPLGHMICIGYMPSRMLWKHLKQFWLFYHLPPTFPILGLTI